VAQLEKTHQPVAVEEDLGDGDEVVGRDSVDYLLRNAHQHLVQLSAQADLKASIMLTTSAVALSFAFSRGQASYTRASLIVLEVGIFAALVCAVLVALPSLPIRRRRQPRHSVDPDLLFFVDIAKFDRDDYVRKLHRILETDEAVYRALSENLHNQSRYLLHTKYKYIRWSYLAFLAGIVAAAATELALRIAG
jgi:Pycsar effector protein